MNEFLKKPYEISIWKDVMGSSSFEEQKLAVIGSDTMTSPNRAFSPKLTKNVNGEITLTFSMIHRYFDDNSGEEIFNPFTQSGYLVNERKVKLKYDDEWFDFIIKNCEESSDSNTFVYTCTNLWINELSKTGYNVELAQELSNNQGTITELASTVLESSDWELDTANSDLIRQWVQEPLYIGRTNQRVQCIDVLSNGAPLVEDDNKTYIESGEFIYFFYSNIANKDTKNIQVLRYVDKEAGNWIFDDNNVVKGPNYRLTDEIEYVNNKPTIIDYQWRHETEFQGYRLNYAPVSKWDPITERYVDLYKWNDTDIYHYTESEYTTSDILFNAVTNGSSFNVANSDILGFYDYGGSSWAATKDNHVQYQTVLYGKEVDILHEMPDLATVNDCEPCIKVTFTNAADTTIGSTNYGSYIFNSGIEDNRDLIHGFSKGEEWACRIRYGLRRASAEVGPALGIIVAGYTIKEDESTGNAYYLIDNSKIYFDLRATGEGTEQNPYNYEVKNNIITGGTFIEDANHKKIGYQKTMSWGDDILPPSRKYVYYAQGSNTPYVWSFKDEAYVARSVATNNTGHYVDSWCAHGKCLKSLSEKELAEQNVGIFLVTNRLENHANPQATYYIRFIEFFKYIEDANGEMLLIGSAPEATEHPVEYFYLPKDEVKSGDSVEYFHDKQALADYLGTNQNNIVQVYNEDCEKIGSIEAAESNYFNIIQDLCEKFQCWAKFIVEHDPDTGKLILDSNNNPIKKVIFKEYVGKDNFAGFKYGINLNSIQRTLDSNEFVSKLIVAQNDNEYVDGGVLTIRNAESNSLGESYILNFSYYLNHGLIDSSTTFNQDYNTFRSDVKTQNNLLNDLNKHYQDIQAAIVRIDGTLNVYREAIDEALILKTKSNDGIEEVTGAASYAAYIASENRNNDADEAVMEWLGGYLTGENVDNGYTGIVTQLQDERNKLSLEADGLLEHKITISLTDVQTIVSADDYVNGLIIELSNGSATKTATFNNYSKVFSWIDFIVSSGGTANFTLGNLGNDYKLCDNTRAEIQDITNIALTHSTTNVFYLIPKEETADDSIKAQIDAAQAEKDQLEKNFFKKYGRFIQEGTWTSDDYVDNNLYYLDALNVSNTSAQPKVTYTINVTEVSELEGLSNYLFDVGDKTYIEDTEFFGWTIQDGLKTPIREEVVVSEVEWSLDTPEENSITVQNYKTQFEDLFQRIGAAVQSIEYKEGAYNRAASMLDSNGLINSQLLTASLNNISGTKFGISSIGTAYVDKDGIVVTDIMKTTNQMKLSSKGLMVSDNAGVTWRTIVSPDGIDISYIKAGIIDAGKINIMDGENTSFRWDKNGITAYSFTSRGGVYEDYVDSTDTTIQTGKTYYVYDETNGGYIIVNPHDEGWYVSDGGGNYSITSDTVINSGTTYYILEENVYLPVNPSTYILQEKEEVDTTYDMSTFVRFDKYGLYGIKNKNNFVANSPDDIEKNASFGVTWEGFFIKNSYGDGYTSITEDEDIKVVKIIPAENEDEEDIEITKVHIGALDRNSDPIKYGISIRNDHDLEVFKTDDEGNVVANNISIRGSIKASVFEYEEIQAIGGILVVRPSSTIKDVVGPYYDTTASTESGEDLPFIGTEIILENPDLFRNKDRCKLGNNGNYYTLLKDEVVVGYEKTNDTDINTNKDYYVAVDVYVLTEDTEPVEGKTYYIDSTSYNYEEVAIDEGDNPAGLGWFELTTVYQLVSSPVIENINDYYETIIETHWILQDFNTEGADYIEYEDLIGSALVAMAHPEFDGVNTIITDNYGIAINSSNSEVQAPQRAITLFETYGETDTPGEITGGEHFSYRGVLGTLPSFSDQETGKVADIYDAYMTGTQGIYTDNMYIGNSNEYVAFYTDGEENKHLAIKANDLILETGSVNEGLITIQSQINAIQEDEGIKNLCIDPSQIILYTTTSNIDDPNNTYVKSGLKLTSDRLQFVLDNELDTIKQSDYYSGNNITWIDNESLNSGNLYFTKAYPRIFSNMILTEDTTVVTGKIYYVYNDSSGEYDIVSQPLPNPAANSYYEQTSELQKENNVAGNLMIYTRSNGHLTIKNIKA